MARDYHAAMEKQLIATFPQFDKKQLKHAVNLVSNYIRDCKQDVYEVWVSDKQTHNAQYANRGSIMVGQTPVYIEIQVD
jgi:hypothetical protein